MANMKVFKKLPVHLQTDVNRKFFQSTVEQLYSNRDTEEISAFIGRKTKGYYNATKDTYLTSPSKDRNNYLLEPTAYTKNIETLEKTNLFYYADLINKIKSYGGNVKNHDRLFATDYYSFCPPIDLDKFINYHNYSWVQDRIPVLSITGVDDTEITTNIIGQTSYTTTYGGNPLDFTSGLRVTFPDSASYTADYTIECVGRGIILVPDYDETLTVDVTITEDYITIERGSADQNAWSRTNKWYHKNVISTVEVLLNTSVEGKIRARRPIIEFERDLELYNGGYNFTYEVDAVSSLSWDDVDGAADGLQLDDYTLLNGDLIIFTNGNVIETSTLWDQSGTFWDQVGGAWDETFSADVVTNYIWQVTISVGTINLTPYTSYATPAEEGDVVRVQNGTTYANASFVQTDGVWEQLPTINEKIAANQAPYFALYDTDGVSLDDPNTYPASTFEGSKIFSYKENSDTGIPDEFLGLSLEYKNLGKIADIVFNHDLETARYQYTISGVTSEIIGYYYYNKLNSDELTGDPSAEFKSTWQPNTSISKQKVIDRYVSSVDEENGYKLSVTPLVAADTIVEVNGIEKEYGTDFTISSNVLTFTGYTVQKRDVIEIYTYSYDDLDSAKRGYFEIPQNLEANPNYEDVTELSLNELTNHFLSIIKNQTNFEGNAFGGTTNYRDTEKDLSKGEYILQNTDSLLKAMFAFTPTLNLVDAIRFSSAEYNRFKNKFLRKAKRLIDTGYTPFEYGDTIPVEQWFEEIMREITLTKDFSEAFAYTYMLAMGNVYKTEEFTGNGITTNYTLTEYVDITSNKNFMYIYVNGVLQQIDTDYRIAGTNPIDVVFTNAPNNLDEIVFRLYENPISSYIPATPSKLGMYPVSKPKRVTETTWGTTIDVIVGHDGSKTVAYNDYRDDLLLELENRIYNNIVETFRVDYNCKLLLEDVKSDKNHTTRYSLEEFNEISFSLFSKWAVYQEADYTLNEFFDINDEWTWNYRGYSNTGDDEMPGHWKGIYEYFYGTQSPNTTPWEMLGFETEPDWWVDEYGIGPYKPVDVDMWTDIQNGYIRQGNRQGTDTRFAHPNLISSYLPVDANGDLLSVIDIGLATEPTDDDKEREWQYGDLGPVEYAWKISSAYPFAVCEWLLLTKPAKFGERFWNPIEEHTADAQPEQIISLTTCRRNSCSTLTTTGEIQNNIVTVNTGYQQYITDLLLNNNQNINNVFAEAIRSLDVSLSSKLSGFINNDTTKVRIESSSVEAENSNIFVPQENIQINLYDSPVSNTKSYSGIKVYKTSDNKFRVYGYDTLSQAFTIIPRSTTSKTKTITVGGKNAPFKIFTIGNTYNKDDIVRYNTVYYMALVTHTATSFITSNWRRLAALPSTGGIKVIKKFDGVEGETETVLYGTQYNNVQEVYDFIISYSDYLESQGWIFDKFDGNTNLISNWNKSAEQFLMWVSTNWTTDSFIFMSPASDIIKFKYDFGYPKEIQEKFNGAYTFLDAYNNPLYLKNLVVDRKDNEISISVDRNTSNQGIYLCHLSFSEVEHVITFDNETSFSDFIYTPLLRDRQIRLKLLSKRSTNWTGKYEAPGYLISDNKIIPNYENLVDSVRYYYSPDESIDNAEIERASRRLIGFNNKEYMDNLQISDEVQFQFYQGMIRQKGSKNAIDKILRSTFVDDEKTINIFEEWAIKTGTYGSTSRTARIDLAIDPSAVKQNPQLIELVYSYDTTKETFPGDATVTVDRTVYNTFDIYMNNQLLVEDTDYEYDPNTPLGSSIVLFLDVTPTSNDVITVVYKNITTDSTNDNTIIVDIDDIDTWLVKPDHTPTTEDLWKTTDNINYLIPNAGYVHPADVTEKLFDSSELFDLDSYTVNDTYWIAKVLNTRDDIQTDEDWNVYKIIDSSINTTTTSVSGQVTFSGTLPFVTSSKKYLHDIVIINGVMYKTELVSGTTYNLFDKDNNPIADNAFVSPKDVYVFASLRFANIAAVDTSYLVDDEYIWIDNNGNSLWEARIVDTAVSATNYEVHRQQTELVDTSLFKNCFIYDKETNKTLGFLNLYDPFKNNIPGKADENIFWKTEADPTSYTNEQLSFGDKEVGKLWWDLSTVRYYYYEQGTNDERKNNWGKTFPGSSIDIYEWVKSDKLPEDWDLDGTVKSTTNYIERTVYDLSLGENKVYYYYWVKNRTKKPLSQKRSLSSFDTARLLRDPNLLAYNWFSPINTNAFLLANADNILTNGYSVVQLNYKKKDIDIPVHTEWKLLRENDDECLIPDYHWNKFVDSVCEEDENGNGVPEPNLSEFEKYGILKRPRQTMFKNINDARNELKTIFNRLCSTIRIRDSYPAWNETTTSIYWTYINWYETGYDELNTIPSRQIDTTGELNTTTLLNLRHKEIIKVLQGEDNRYSLYEYDLEEDDFTLIGRENATIKLLDTISTDNSNEIMRTELRELLTSVKENVFIDADIVNTNLLFFGMLNYVLLEQEECDWLFKTSYVKLNQTGDTLTQPKTFQKETFDDILDYINEVKPYHTKIRDYRITKSTEPDLAEGTAQELSRDFTIHLHLDRIVCDLSTEDIRIAMNIPDFTGYVQLEDGGEWDGQIWDSITGTWDDSVTREIRLGEAGRIVALQTQFANAILNVPAPAEGQLYAYESFSSITYPPDNAELSAIEQIQAIVEEALCPELYRTIDGYTFTQATSLWDTNQAADEELWDVNAWDNNTATLNTFDGEEFTTQVAPDQIETGTGATTSFAFTFTPSSGGSTLAVFINGTQTVDYYLSGSNIIFLDAPALNAVIYIYDHWPIDAGYFKNPYVDGVPQEQALLDIQESLSIRVDTNTTSEGFTQPYFIDTYLGSDTIYVTPYFEGTIDVYTNAVLQVLSVDYTLTSVGEFNQVTWISVPAPTDTITIEYSNPAQVSYRIFLSNEGWTKYSRISANHTTTLSAALNVSDTTISVVDGTKLPVATMSNPGIIWIGSERIEYYTKVGNTLSNIRRGTKGTSRVTTHAMGSKVIDGSNTHTIPSAETAIWTNSGGGLSASSTVQGVFLRSQPGSSLD